MAEQKEPGARLRIEQTSLSPRSTKVWLDGVELSHCLDRLQIEWSADEITGATLTIGIRELNIDARTIAHLIGQAVSDETAGAVLATLQTLLGEHHADSDRR